jgi:hypothetical protein
MASLAPAARPPAPRRGAHASSPASRASAYASLSSGPSRRYSRLQNSHLVARPGEIDQTLRKDEDVVHEAS